MKWNLFNKREIEEQKKHKTKHCYSKSNSSFNIQLFNTHVLIFSAHSKFLKNTASNKATIPKATLTVNTQGLNFGLFVYSGTINAAPNHPAERLIKRSERTPNQIEPIRFTLTTIGSTVNADQADDFKIFNYELNPVQIKTLYNSGATRFGPASGVP